MSELKIPATIEAIANFYALFPVLSLVFGKTCKKCNENKPLVDFNLHRNLLFFRRNVCRYCTHIEYEQYSAKNKQQILERGRAYRKANAERINALARQKFANNPEKYQEIKRRSAEKNRTRRNEHNHARYRNDVAYRLRRALRSRVNCWLRLFKKEKSGSAVLDCGCTLDELKKHIESKWLPGMSWGNYGKKGWHIDHIVPLINFDPCVREQFLKACHFSNLQPLWWIDNLKKGSRVQ